MKLFGAVFLVLLGIAAFFVHRELSAKPHVAEGVPSQALDIDNGQQQADNEAVLDEAPPREPALNEVLLPPAPADPFRFHAGPPDPSPTPTSEALEEALGLNLEAMRLLEAGKRR